MGSWILNTVNNWKFRISCMEWMQQYFNATAIHCSAPCNCMRLSFDWVHTHTAVYMQINCACASSYSISQLISSSVSETIDIEQITGITFKPSLLVIKIIGCFKWIITFQYWAYKYRWFVVTMLHWNTFWARCFLLIHNWFTANWKAPCHDCNSQRFYPVQKLSPDDQNPPCIVFINGFVPILPVGG